MGLDTRWGVHYLPSLLLAHQSQMCTNFKDPGVQNYGGALFVSIRDATDDLFCALPPPQPSVRVGAEAAATARVAARPVVVAPASMAMFHNSFAG